MSFWNKFIDFLVGPPTGERARDNKGRYKADDKSTKGVNEAYKDGRTPPKRRGRPKGSKNKKAK
jgi:hypothetical protein